MTTYHGSPYQGQGSDYQDPNYQDPNYQDPNYSGPPVGSDVGPADVARSEASQLGQRAGEAGGQVAQTTKEQAQQVVGEAAQQARDLMGEARAQAREQAGSQRDRLVSSLRAFGDELDQMALQGGQSGLATELARQLSDRTRGLAGALDGREPADLLNQVRSFARRRPGTFLLGAALAGVVAGRLTRGVAAQAQDDQNARPAVGRTGYTDYPQYGSQYPAGAAGVGEYAAGGYGAPGYSGPAPATGYTEGYPDAGYQQTDAGYQSYQQGGYPAPGQVPAEQVAYPGQPDPMTNPLAPQQVADTEWDAATTSSGYPADADAEEQAPGRWTR